MDSVEPQRRYETASGIPVKRVYTPEDAADLNYDKDIGLPGEPPYIRGIYPNMYRERPWRIYQLTGSGSIEEERERVLFAIKHGETAFMLEPDQQVCCSMMDVDHPEILCRKEDVGITGTPQMSLRDIEELLDGIPIDKLYGAAGFYPMDMSFFQACYWEIAKKRGIPLSKLHGGSHGDMFAAYIGSPFFNQIPPRDGFRFVCDGIEFCVQNKMDRWVPCDNPGYNARANGINAYQEVAMVLACAIDRIEEILRRGRLKIDDFAPGLAACNFAAWDDLFEEVAKMRAARRMWYKLLKERYHAENPRSLALRMHSITCSHTFTYQEPLNNIVRNAVRALVGALAGVQAMGTASHDEAIAVPSQEAALVAIRTQQIIQYEMGLDNVVDPLGGSYYVEHLTNEVEEHAWKYLEEIENQGGLLGAIESGWVHSEAMKGSLEEERRLNSGEQKLVGANFLRMEEQPYSLPAHRPDPQAWDKAMERLEKLRKERDNQKVKEALDKLRRVVQSDENILPTMTEAVKTYITVGEVGDLWREIFGVWKTPIPL